MFVCPQCLHNRGYDDLNDRPFVNCDNNKWSNISSENNDGKCEPEKKKIRVDAYVNNDVILINDNETVSTLTTPNSFSTKTNVSTSVDVVECMVTDASQATSSLNVGQVPHRNAIDDENDDGYDSEGQIRPFHLNESDEIGDEVAFPNINDDVKNNNINNNLTPDATSKFKVSELK